jgi:rhodanese-related sulfurtransferase
MNHHHARAWRPARTNLVQTNARCTNGAQDTPNQLGARLFFAHKRFDRIEATMTTTDTILATARQRATDQAYAGAVTPDEAYTLLRSDPRVKLVDVRTDAERDWVGRAAIPDAQHLAVQWMRYPGGAPNPDFGDQLEQLARKDDVLLFLCRSGVRSRHGARVATERGFADSYDILEGFEGDRDADGHRKTLNGWCKAGLPWIGA